MCPCCSVAWPLLHLLLCALGFFWPTCKEYTRCSAGWLSLQPSQWQMRCQMIPSAGFDFLFFWERSGFQQDCGLLLPIALSNPDLTAYRLWAQSPVVNYTELATWMVWTDITLLASDGCTGLEGYPPIVLHLHSCAAKRCANATQRRWYLPSSGGQASSLSWRASSKCPFLQKGHSCLPWLPWPSGGSGNSCNGKDP